VEATTEELDAHDAEDEPEDEADQQHVEDGRYGLYKCVHHHLVVTTDRPSDPVSNKHFDGGRVVLLLQGEARTRQPCVHTHQEHLLGCCLNSISREETPFYSYICSKLGEVEKQRNTGLDPVLHTVLGQLGSALVQGHTEQRYFSLLVKVYKCI
jgi:hypothetical protein